MEMEQLSVTDANLVWGREQRPPKALSRLSFWDMAYTSAGVAVGLKESVLEKRSLVRQSEIDGRLEYDMAPKFVFLGIIQVFKR